MAPFQVSARLSKSAPTRFQVIFPDMSLVVIQESGMFPLHRSCGNLVQEFCRYR